MKKNPFLISEDRLVRLYQNTMTMVYVTRERTYNPDTGAVGNSESEHRREIAFSDPDTISESAANGKNWIVGDMLFDVSRLGLERNMPSGRTANIETCGIHLDTDYVVFSGERYRIVKMTPKTVWCGVPARYRIQVRLNR